MAIGPQNTDPYQTLNPLYALTALKLLPVVRPRSVCQNLVVLLHLHDRKILSLGHPPHRALRLWAFAGLFK